MSTRPILFLAHSSADKPLVGALAAEIRRLVADRFDVFFDADSIPPGADWSALLEENLLDCSAAVLVLSPHANQAPYMPHEAFLLSLRKRFDAQLGIFPVFAGGMNEAALATSPFRHCRIDVQQAVTLPADGSVTAAGDSIATALAADGDWLPWRSVERLAADTLRTLSPDGLEQAAEALLGDAEDQRALALARNRHRWLARRLFRLSVDELGEFAHRIAPFFRQDPRGLVELLRTVLPFTWVPDADARILRDEAVRPPPRRAVALGYRIAATSRSGSGAAGPTAVPSSPFPHVPDLYARRASSRVPSWKVVTGEAAWSHQAADDITEQLRTLARELVSDHFGAYDDDQLRAELCNLFSARGETVLVVLPKAFASTDAGLLEQMTGFSESFTFLVACDQHQPDLVRRFPNLVLLPEVPLPKQIALHRACARAQEALPPAIR